MSEATSNSISRLQSQVQQQQAAIQTNFEAAQELYFPTEGLNAVLDQLLDNAIRYKSPDRNLEIKVSTEQLPDMVALKIEDNGIGIDLAKHGEKLFQMFKRLNKGKGGSGIGLYIVKRIIDKSGGKIDVESQPGKGTIFTLMIPQPKIL